MSGQLGENLTIDEVAASPKAGKQFGRLQKTPRIKAWSFRCGNLDQWITSRIGNAVVDDDKGAE